MERAMLEHLLQKVQGCSFASVDLERKVGAGVVKRTNGIRVLLYTNKKVSTYEQMVKRRLKEAGKNPDDFKSGDLPWGHQVPNSPLVEHKDEVYLKYIILAQGQSEYYQWGERVDNPENLMLGERDRTTNQGLPPGEEVLVCVVMLKHIKRIALMGEQIVSDTRSTLPVGA